jgi:hypothetical protein
MRYVGKGAAAAAFARLLCIVIMELIMHMYCAQNQCFTEVVSWLNSPLLHEAIAMAINCDTRQKRVTIYICS